MTYRVTLTETRGFGIFTGGLPEYEVIEWLRLNCANAPKYERHVVHEHDITKKGNFVNKRATITRHYDFKDPSDAMLFKLTWGGQ